jgi:hypothetical protein
MNMPVAEVEWSRSGRVTLGVLLLSVMGRSGSSPIPATPRSPCEAFSQTVHRVCKVLLNAARCKGGFMKTGLRFRALVAAVLAVVFVDGCATPPLGGSSVTYWYEPQFSFAALKTYQWAAKPQYGSWRDPLLESNVRFLADGVLQTKGFASTTNKADFIVSMRYEGNDVYELRALTLYVSLADNNELVWRGVATGAIKTGASSGDLKNAVAGILVNFPPK